MKLLIYLAVWKRPEITEICFMGIKRLQRVPGFNIRALAVISEEEMIPLCDKYGVQWCMYKNFPLGEKKNYGLREAMKIDFDYLVEIGSDDLLKNEYLTLFPWNRNVMMLNDFITVDSKTLDCRKLSGLHAGLGRAIKKDVLWRCGDLWDDGKQRGLDGNSFHKLAEMGIMWNVYKGELAIDIKSDVNIWPFRRTGERYSIDDALDGLSEDEVMAIKMLSCATVEN